MQKLIFFAIIYCCLFGRGLSELWCYQCVSSQPGCGGNLDWRIHHSISCPKDDDKCVRITERKGAQTFITRDCLSNLEGLRKDIPADHYEGCRPAAEQPKLAVYVDNFVSQPEIRRDYWNEITYCFCEFDHWCNNANSISIKTITMTLLICLVLLIWLQQH